MIVKGCRNGVSEEGIGVGIVVGWCWEELVRDKRGVGMRWEGVEVVLE